MSAYPLRFTVDEISQKIGGRPEGPPDAVVTGIAALEEAGPEDLVFISGEKFAPKWESSRARVALVSRRVASKVPVRAGTTLIHVEDADLALATLLESIAPDPPEAGLPASAPDGAAAVHPSAVVDPSAKLGRGVRIGAQCVVGPRARIGEGAVLYPGSAVYDDAAVGRDSVLWSGATVRERCAVGDRVSLHANAVIGADGFGYRPAPGGRGVMKIPHIGRVEIGNDVEIGANTCVDRGKLSATVVGDHCKIDNLCQIGHNCRLGRGVIIAGKVGLSGSVTIGDGVMIGGGAGVADHVTIGAGAAIAAAAGVMRDVPPGGKVSGIPARDIKQFFREQAAVARLPDMLRQPRVVAAGQAPSVAPPTKKSFHDWLEGLNAKSVHKIVIRDFDGLDHADFEQAYRGTPMTEKEFQKRLSRCTFNLKA
jgi:UDP-3-O-[3-hydroxymyristoyl] glucosamine N-acyltransferase